MIDDTESDEEGNDYTDHDAGSESEDINIDEVEALDCESDNLHDYDLLSSDDEIEFVDNGAGDRHEL